MKIYSLFLIIFSAVFTIQAQTVQREFPLSENAEIEINNLYGRVDITAEETDKAFLTAENTSESNLKTTSANNRLEVIVNSTEKKPRIDLSLKVPLRARVHVVTNEGEVLVSGDLESASVETETGTIAAQVPLDDLRYSFLWTASRPRFLSDVDLEKVKEKAAGRFQVKGKIVNEDAKKEEAAAQTGEVTEPQTNGEEKPKDDKDKKTKPKAPKIKTVALNFTTARGIILLNVNPGEVPSDLRERPLTEAAKTIIRSGDSMLMEAIRRSSPKFFGEYAATLPPLKKSPSLTQAPAAQELIKSSLKKVLVRVTDINNRAVSDLKKDDFEISESGESREILSVQPATAPFNLVLLLDVSGSVDNYVDFIRKAARNFVNTVSPQDKVAIIIFNEDVKTLSTFTTDKGKLSESLDTFDAGGSTAFYDALAYTLVDTLRPLRGERTAIVTLSDGDDNRSFLPFDSLIGSIQESGALVYPLYVPSALVAASANNNPNLSVDPLRTRYMGLTSKAENEGERLAQISGGVYYPIRQLSDLQKAYDDIVIQLRTAYTVTFRSDLAETSNKTTASPRLKVRIKQPNTFIKLGSVVAVSK